MCSSCNAEADSVMTGALRGRRKRREAREGVTRAWSRRIFLPSRPFRAFGLAKGVATGGVSIGTEGRSHILLRSLALSLSLSFCSGIACERSTAWAPVGAFFFDTGKLGCKGFLHSNAPSLLVKLEYCLSGPWPNFPDGLWSVCTVDVDGT